MTFVATEPRSASRRRADATDALRPVALTAALSAGSVAIAGLILTVSITTAAWLAQTVGSVSDATRVGVFGWLMAHGAPVSLPSGRLSLMPLGLSVLIAVGLFLAGRFAARTSAIDGPRDLAYGVGALTGTYALAAAAVTELAAGDSVHTPLPLAVLTSAGFALLFGGGGLLRTALASDRPASGLRYWGRQIRRTTVAMVAVLMLESAIVLAVAVVEHLDQIGEFGARMRPGTVGGIVMVLVAITLLPNVLLLALAYTLGPGFTIGSSAVAASGIEIHRLPAWPLFGMFGTESHTPGYPMLLIAAVPVLAGLWGGYWAAKRAALSADAWWAGVLTAAVGAVGATLATVLGWWLTHGQLGGPRTRVSAVVWPTMGWLGAGLLAGALLSAVAVSLWRLRAGIAAGEFDADLGETPDSVGAETREESGHADHEATDPGA